MAALKFEVIDFIFSLAYGTLLLKLKKKMKLSSTTVMYDDNEWKTSKAIMNYYRKTYYRFPCTILQFKKNYDFNYYYHEFERFTSKRVVVYNKKK